MNSVVDKIIEANKKLENFYEVFNCYDISFLNEIFKGTHDKASEEAYNALKVKYFRDQCDEELLKDPKIILNLMLAF